MQIRLKIDGYKTIMMVVLAAVFVAGGLMLVDTATAQNQDDPAQVRNRQEARNTDQEPKGDALQQRIRDRIENEEGLQTQERQQLKQHLGECKQLGLEDATLAVLFDESQPLKKQLRTQERILNMIREGLPAEPVMRKLQEGQRKGVTAEVLEKVCTQMENHVRTADRVMKQARQDGLASGDPVAEQKRTGEMAMHMWRGLKEDNMDQLRERARLRLRDGSCSTQDLTVASETAAKIKELGIEQNRAVKLAGEALQYGYTVQEMRQLGWMVMTAHMRGGQDHEVMEMLEKGIRNQHQLGEMMQQMQQHGWMGPADEHGGHGSKKTMDDVTGGGPGGQGSDQGKHGGMQ